MHVAGEGKCVMFREVSSIQGCPYSVKVVLRTSKEHICDIILEPL
jgi:hypothetical protein